MSETVLEFAKWASMFMWAFGLGVLVAMRDCGASRKSYAGARDLARNGTIRMFYFTSLLAAPFTGATYVLIAVTAMLRGKDCP